MTSSLDVVSSSCMETTGLLLFGSIMEDSGGNSVLGQRAKSRTDTVDYLPLGYFMLA